MIFLIFHQKEQRQKSTSGTRLALCTRTATKARTGYQLGFGGPQPQDAVAGTGKNQEWLASANMETYGAKSSEIRWLSEPSFFSGKSWVRSSAEQVTKNHCHSHYVPDTGTPAPLICSQLPLYTLALPVSGWGHTPGGPSRSIPKAWGSVLLTLSSLF